MDFLFWLGVFLVVCKVIDSAADYCSAQLNYLIFCNKSKAPEGAKE